MTFPATTLIRQERTASSGPQLSRYSRYSLGYLRLPSVSGGVAGLACRPGGLVFREVDRALRPPSEEYP